MRAPSAHKGASALATVPPPLSAAERTLYTRPTRLLPTDGIVKATSDKITAGATGDLAKARRIYDWIVLNTVRDPKTRGCGIGDVSFMLRTGDLDCAIVAEPFPDAGLAVAPLYDEPFMVAVPTGHPLAKRSAISAEELKNMLVGARG